MNEVIVESLPPGTVIERTSTLHHEHQQIRLQAGTVVLVRGIPMRLLSEAIVESHRCNFRLAGLEQKEGDPHGNP